MIYERDLRLANRHANGMRMRMMLYLIEYLDERHEEERSI